MKYVTDAHLLKLNIMKLKCQVIEKQKRHSLEVATVSDTNKGLKVLKACKNPRQL